jgi:hypothetical protein
MVKVGMYKQQKYDEGIQKIQTNIDNIAGLDVIRDVDKAYLQSKLNQLGNNLTTVAAGDFSNFQLVNSVNGMTNQIARDPNVLNAISSAKTYRKGLEDMDAANKAGKGSASHDWLFKTDASDWLNNQDINKTFNGGYKQYSPYQKNAQEVIKGLVKNETGKDVAFEYDKNGNMIVLDAMTRTKISGITPERIQSALMVGLSPNDWQSMQIDGRYNYANTTPEQFASDLNKSYKSDYDKIKELRNLTANALDSSNSAVIRTKLQQQIDSLDKSLKTTQDEYSSVSKTFAQGDVESAKARYYSTKWMNNFANTFASQSVDQQYVASPFIQVKQFNETKALEYKKWLADHNQRNTFHQDELYFKTEGLKIDKAKLKIEQDAAAAASPYGGVPVAVNQDELPEVTLKMVNDKIALDDKLITDSDNAIMERFKKSGDLQWLNQQRGLWQKNPGNVDARLAKHFKQTEITRREVAANTTMVADIAAQADLKYGTLKNLIPQNAQNVFIKYGNGENRTYSPEDFVKFNQDINFKYYKILGLTRDPNVAKKIFSGKQYDLWNAYAKNNRGETLTPNEIQLLNNLTYYNTNVNSKYYKQLSDKDAYVADQVQKRTVAMQGVEYGVPLNNESQKTSFGNALVGFANLADSQDGGLPNSPGLNITELREIAGDVQNASIRLVEATDFAPATYKITVANKEGTTQTFMVPVEAYRSVFGDRFEADPALKAIRPYEVQRIRAGGGTTALDGQQTNVGNAFLGNALDFVNVRHYSVSGNVETEQDGTSSIRLNISDPRTGEVLQTDLGYPKGGLIEKNKVASAIQGLTDQTIFEMLYNRKPTAAELKELQE